MIKAIIRFIGLFLQALIFTLLVSLIVMPVSCSSLKPIDGMKTASIEQTKKELEDIIKHGDNLTPAQKIVLQHAAADLKDAQATQKQAVKLQEQVIKASEKAGAGKLIYYIMYFVVFLVAAFLGFKIMRKFSLF